MMWLKKISALVVMISILSSSLAGTVFANGSRISVNGTEASMSNDVYFIDGYNFAPMGEIMKLLGANVEWEPETKTVTARKDGTEVIITIGSTDALVNGEHVTLDAAPRIIGGVTYVPVGFIGKALGYDVSWSPETKTVMLETPNVEKGRIDLSFKPRYSEDLTYEQARVRAIMFSSDLRSLNNQMNDLRDAREEVSAEYSLSMSSLEDLDPATQQAIASNVMDSTRSVLSSLESMNITLETEPYRREMVEGAAALSAKSSFYAIADAQNTIAETEAQIELSSRALENSRLMLELGMMSQADFENAEITHKQLLETREINERALETEYVGLNRLLGYDSSKRYNVVIDDVYEPLGEDFLIDNYVTVMTGISPTVKIAEGSLKDAKNKLTMFSGTTQTEYQQAKTAVNTADLELGDAKRNYEKGIRSLYNNLRNLEASIAASELELEKSEAALRTAIANYETGNITELELQQQFYAVDAAKKNIEIMKLQHGLMKYQFENPYLA